MKKWISISAIILLVVAIGIVGYLNSQKVATEQKLYVVTTSADIADIVKDVGGDKVKVECIVPPGQCPGHFDIKPQTIETLKKAKLFLRHDYESQKFSDKLIESAGNKNLVVVTLGGNATFMVPPMRLKGIDGVTNALIKVDPKNAESYKKSATKLKDETKQIAAEQKKRLQAAGADKTKVIVALYQTGFAKWAGFDVVASYPPDISLNDAKRLADLGRQEGVTLIIDNLQSPNKAAAQTLSKELGIPVVTLSNFPGGLQGTQKWSDSFIKNVDLVLAQLQKKKSSAGTTTKELGRLVPSCQMTWLSPCIT